MFVWVASFQEADRTVTIFHGSTKEKAIGNLIEWMMDSSYDEDFEKIFTELEEKGFSRIIDECAEVKRFDYE